MNHPDDLDDDDALPPHLRRLLDEGGDGPPLSTAAQQRVLGRVLATVGVATVGVAPAAAAAAQTTTATTATTTAGATGTASAATATMATTAAAATTAATGAGLALSVKAAVLAAGLGLVGVGGAGIVVATTRAPTLPARDPSPPSVAHHPSPAEAPAPSPDLVEATPDTEIAAAPTPSPVAAPSSRPPSSSRPVTTPSLDSSWELPQLESARTALAAGDAAQALTLVEDHARRAPGSALREEGRALEVLALVALGRRDEAQAAAAAFAARHPQSLFLPRVQRAVSSPSAPLPGATTPPR